MARVYDIAVAALAIGVERKWLDNLTSQHSIPGAEHFARGVPRRLSMRTLLTAAIVKDLNRELGVPVQRAVQIAASVLGAEPPATVGSATAGSITIAVDAASLENDIERRLLEAMETVVPRRRGRPPRKERRGTH